MLNIISKYLGLAKPSTPIAGDNPPSLSVINCEKWQPIGIGDFLKLETHPREMLLSPVLPESSLSMVYAPRGMGKSLYSMSIGLAVASGGVFLGWFAPKPRRVLYVDGEMAIVDLKERLAAISAGLGIEVPNENFRILAADQTESGINLGEPDGQKSLEALLDGVDLLILDNLSTLCTTGSEAASDAWIPMQSWLLSLRRKGIAVLLVHHAGVNGRQRGTSRREDALDVVMALKRPAKYSPAEGARFEIHFEKIRQRVEGFGGPFEAKATTVLGSGQNRLTWSRAEIGPSPVARAAELFAQGLTVRQVAVQLGISKSEAGRLKQRLEADARDKAEKEPKAA
jgi:putative DNA primase/helicase